MKAVAYAACYAAEESLSAGQELPPAERRNRFEAETLVHLDALFSFAMKLARSRADAEDLVSETLVRAFDRWEQYRLGTNIRAWLSTILFRVFVSRKRHIDSREVQPSDDSDRCAAFEPVGEADPERCFYDSFLDDEITRAIGALPDKYRSVVVMSDLQEMRDGEIAQLLGVPEGTVKSRLYRARSILREKLVGYAIDMSYIKLATPIPR
jgi:RNA polymerase sigma-70 factor (ECF subfamily)